MSDLSVIAVFFAKLYGACNTTTTGNFSETFYSKLDKYFIWLSYIFFSSLSILPTGRFLIYSLLPPASVNSFPLLGNLYWRCHLAFVDVYFLLPNFLLLCHNGESCLKMCPEYLYFCCLVVSKIPVFSCILWILFCYLLCPPSWSFPFSSKSIFQKLWFL